MSVCIVFDRQFIRSEEGITPCWLSGDNRTWTGSDPHAKMCRNWSVFHNLLGVTEAELLAEVNKYLGGSMHWRAYGGKDVDDASYLRWIRNGCKAAATIEEILGINNMRAVPCYVAAWDKGDCRKEVLKVYVSNTEGLDQWIRDAKSIIAQVKADGGCAYPVINFFRDKLNHPARAGKDPSQQVVLKRKGTYLYKLVSSGSLWCADPRKAMVFTFEEAKSLQISQRYGWVAEAILVDASVKDYPYNAVLKFSDGRQAGMYLGKRTCGKLSLYPYPDPAVHYKDWKHAEQAIARIGSAYRGAGNIEVELVSAHT